MNVRYITEKRELTPWSRRDRQYKHTGPHPGDADESVWCCDGMREAWRERFIDFGERGELWSDSAIVAIFRTDVYPEGSFSNALEILFCPFCGEPINLVDETPHDATLMVSS